MPKCDEILSAVLDRSGLQRRDGHPLYSYRLTLDELEQLRVELANRFQIAQKLRTAEEKAAFCLFASEYFRREYERGVWSWSVIFDGVKCDPVVAQSLQSKRGEYTIEGLRWWNLDVIRTAASQRYLTTLVCQGGFPINTLRNDGASLSRMLRQCLRQHELYPTEPVGEIILEYIDYLPETLREAEVRYLVEKVVEAIASLRRRSDDAVDKGIRRRDFLDEHVPGWHEQMPFRIEDVDAQNLVLTLLDVQKAQALDRQPLAILTTLDDSDGRFRVQRSLQHPSGIESATLLRILNLDDQTSLYPRMTGFLKAGETRAQVCNIAKPFTGSNIRIQPAGARQLVGDEACGQTTMLVRSGLEEVADAPLPGGEALPISPWIFNAEPPHQLIGVGSVKTRHESVMVAMPDGAVLEADDAESLDQKLAERDVYRVSGDASIRDDDTIYRIRTREKESEELIYELRGQRRRLGSSGSDMWLGPPSVFEIRLDDSEKPRQLSPAEVSWRPRKGGGWSPMRDDCLGDVVVRADVDGECKLMVGATVFPPDFSLTVRPSSTVNEGRLIFRGLGDADVYMAETTGVTFNVTGDEQERTVTVSVSGDRPDTVLAKIRSCDQVIAEVRLVCPTQACHLIDAAGCRIDSNRGIPLDRLDGVRLRLIQPTGQQPFVMELLHSQIIDKLTESSTKGVWEYPLSFLKDRAVGLLAMSDEPDGEVELGVKVGAALTPKFKWRIARYGHRIEPVKDNSQTEAEREQERRDGISRVRIADRKARQDVLAGDASIRVLNLNSPKAVLPAESVTFDGPGQWSVQHADVDPGYYLVTGRTNMGETFRPLRIVSRPDQVVAPADDKPTSEYTFDEVSSIRNKHARREVWDQYFDRLIDDLSDPGWEKVNDVVEASMTLPVTTFEAVAALTRNPIAVARYGILQPNNATLWQRLEELPFLWSLVPVSAWVTCASRILNYFRGRMASIGLTEEQIRPVVESKTVAFATSAPDRNPAMSCIASCLFHADLVDPQLLKLVGTTQRDRDLALSSLIQRHKQLDTRQTWPNFKIQQDELTREILNSTPGLLNRDTHQNQWAVINGPTIAAIHSVYEVPISDEQLRGFKRLRSLDSEWFDAANHYAMYHVATRRLKEEPMWIQNLIQSPQPTA